MPSQLGRMLAAIVLLAASATAQQDRTVARQRMVDEQLKARGIKNAAVLDAMARVPRHEFVPENVQPFAYEDRPLPIGRDQTISQPYIVAYMTEVLEPSRDDVVLEIGTGSGYQAAILAELVREVYTIEIVPELAERATTTLARLGYKNVHVRTGNGYLGWPEKAPFRRIIVTAAPPEVPQALVDQLATDGRMVVPVGNFVQEMTIITKTQTGVRRERTIPVRFVPMVQSPR